MAGWLLLPILLAAIFSGSAAGQERDDDIAVADRLIEALERENAALRQRLATEQKANALLAEINETRKAENAALRETLAAKNETISAKNAVLDAQERLIRDLRERRRSVWARIGDIAIGAAIGAVLR
ncbi:MAG TPA: hypothetical protein PKD24_14640 [Pyrinomonadaceae bacterium]|nr:hypothetical protein [Pyrinomonadaceae bacterium]HMP66611.1 hypothetical protein [Pyrinomonadaceae bacterium]